MRYSVDNLISYDLEVYPNYFLAGFLLPTGELYQYGFTHEDTSAYDELSQFINWVESSEYTLVGFNSNHYDDPVLSEFLAVGTVGHAYQTSIKIIEQDVPTWDFHQDIFSIDLIKVLPGKLSLKKVGVCLVHTKLQELPFDPHKALTVDEMEVIKKYNVNDLEITEKLHKEIYKELILRQDLSQEYGIDLRSKGEAAVAELILCTLMTQQTGFKKNQLKNIARENVDANPNFYVTAPTWWDQLNIAEYPTIQSVIDKADEIFKRNIHIYDYRLEEKALNAVLYVGDRWYQMGIGGLHSIDGAGAWVPKENETLMDVDVRSYYPELMLTQNLSPRHWIIDGHDYFREGFQPIVTKRINAKLAGDKVVADRLKIVVNGTFGKTNDKYSALYDPYIMACVTVRGQLALLVLVAMVHDVGGSIVSANTDGITILYDDTLDTTIRKVVTEWEALTQLTMEYCEYQGFYQKDVNNYIAVAGDELKIKGVFNIPKMGGVDLRHTPNYQIVARAVREKIATNKDIHLTITECRDIQEFLLTQYVNKTFSVTWRDQHLGNMVRFYKAVDGSDIIRTPIHDQVKGNRGLVAGSESSVPLPDLPESFDSIPDLDYDWYINKAIELWKTVTAPKKKGRNEIARLFESDGMIPTIVPKGKVNRISTKVGDIDFTSMGTDEAFAVCTGRHYGVIAKCYTNGTTEFYKVSKRYPSRTRDKIQKDYGFKFLFGSNVEASPYSLLYKIDEDLLDTYYTESELKKVREPK